MLKLVCVGKIKEKFLIDGINEYSKRINGYDKFQIIEVKEFNQKTIKQNMQDEAKAILQEINDKDFVITLEIKGKMLSSPELAEEILKIKNPCITGVFIYNLIFRKLCGGISTDAFPPVAGCHRALSLNHS